MSSFKGSFIWRHARLKTRELREGFRLGLLSEEQAIKYCLLAATDGGPVPPVMEELSLLLREQESLVGERLGPVYEDSAEGLEDLDARRVWLYLTLSSLWEDTMDGQNLTEENLGMALSEFLLLDAVKPLQPWSFEPSSTQPTYDLRRNCGELLAAGRREFLKERRGEGSIS